MTSANGATWGATRLVVSVDTEADNLWAAPAEYTCENIRRLPRFQSLCERHGIRPTYFVSHEVMADATGVSTMARIARSGGCEVGAHVHPFSTPPEYPVTAADRITQPFAYEYPTDVIRAKLDTLTTEIEVGLAVRPRVIRWGRWGLNGVMVGVMEEYDYLVDSSVTPGIDWKLFAGRRRRQAPSFRRAPAWPYFLDSRDVSATGSSRILEVPPTIVFPRAWHRRAHHSLGAIRLGAVGRALGVGPQWLRPFPWIAGERLLAIADLALRQRLPVLHLMLHSSELLPGGSPYAATEDDVERVLESLDRFFGALVVRGVQSIGLEALYDVYRLDGALRPT